MQRGSLQGRAHGRLRPRPAALQSSMHATVRWRLGSSAQTRPPGVGAAGARRRNRCRLSGVTCVFGAQDNNSSEAGSSERTGMISTNSFDFYEAEAPRGGGGGLGGLARRASAWSANLVGRLLYQYYNWRTSTVSDLQLFLLLNAGLFVLAGAIEGAILRGIEEGSAAAAAAAAGGGAPELEAQAEDAWLSLYAVFKTVFGQDMPDLGSSFVHQVFAVTTVVAGLASFTLVLALVEQVVLEVLEVNVKVGSPVYEQGHTVLLGWCEAASEAEQITRMLKQLCLAYRPSGGRTIAVLTQHGKVEMEAAFRVRLPPDQRHGSTLVFRCGSPLDPAALRMMSCATADTIILSGDYSRSPAESDDQVVRACVLLDEMLLARRQAATAGGGPPPAAAGAAAGRWPTVVAQVKSLEALGTLAYTCGDRVLGLPTKSANARRLARMVQLPETAALLRCLSSYASTAHLRLLPAPQQLVGCSVGHAGLYLPDAALLGLQQARGGGADAAADGQQPGSSSSGGSSNGSLASSSTSSNGSLGSTSGSSLTGSAGGLDDELGSAKPLPLPGSIPPVIVNPPPNTLIRAGDVLVLLSGESPTVLQRPLCVKPDPVRSIPSLWAPREPSAGGAGGEEEEAVPEPSIVVGGLTSVEEEAGLVPGAGAAADAAVLSAMDASDDDWPSPSASAASAEADEEPGAGAAAGTVGGILDGSSPQEYRLPEQYYALTDDPQRLLVCGWGCPETMAELICALDRGPQALPPGSCATMVNHHPECAQVLDDIIRQHGITNIQLRHVQADPRRRAALSAAVDVGYYSAALILADDLWQTGAGAGPGGGEMDGASALLAAVPSSGGSRSLHEALRMDASVLGVQLNLRMLLAASGSRDINIICEKRSRTGVTRFEDMNRLPLGVVFDTASFSARLLAQVAVTPLVWGVYDQLGRTAHFIKVDAGELAAEQEELTYCQLQQRALLARQSVLLGYCQIPERGCTIRLEVNPQGEEARTTPRVWNAGDGRCKLLLLAPKHSREEEEEGEAAACEAAAAALQPDRARSEEAAPAVAFVNGRE